MPRPRTTDRLLLLRQKRDQLDAQLKALEARKKQAERKADTRRKVIAGALALEHFAKNRDSEFGRVMFRLLDEYVVRPHDRLLFPDLPEPQAAAADTGGEFVRAGRETAAGAPPPAP
ncbi:MAG TPA: mobilization protein [Stellaceae bacterium]|nr:mobilization protein [Stellaceae bacterium]